MHFQLVYSFNVVDILCHFGCFMKINLENSKFLWISLLSICQELCFLSPTRSQTGHTAGWVGMDAQSHSEGIAWGSPLPVPGQCGPEPRADAPSPAQSGRGGRHAST